MITTLWFKGLLSRRPGRLVGALVGIALTVALITILAAFTVSSGFVA